MVFSAVDIQARFRAKVARKGVSRKLQSSPGGRHPIASTQSSPATSTGDCLCRRLDAVDDCRSEAHAHTLVRASSRYVLNLL